MQELIQKQPVVFITGASSGLGMEMAREFSRRGYRLALAARRKEALVSLQTELSRLSGTDVHCYRLDVTYPERVEKVLQQAQQDMGQLDVVIANAGVGEGHYIGRGPWEAVERMVSTNITGLMATLEVAARLFLEQGSGQLVAISSVAGFRGLPRSAVYCATKSAVLTYMDALRIEMRNQPIGVTTIAPGFIDTPINEGMPFRPFLIDAETGARKMVDAIVARKRFAFVPGYPWLILARLLRCLPDPLLYKLLKG